MKSEAVGWNEIQLEPFGKVTELKYFKCACQFDVVNIKYAELTDPASVLG